MRDSFEVVETTYQSSDARSTEREANGGACDERVELSVCMATFNGERFLVEQLDSILRELGPHDELVIVDDASTDGTRAILERYRDRRIKLHFSPVNRGIVASFEAAMQLSKGEIILLSDQDDKWIPGRVALMVDAMRRTGALVVASNWLFMDPTRSREDMRVKPLRAKDSTRHFMNLLRMFTGTAAYYGCGMAVHRSLLRLVLPIPRFVESHDLWIAMAGNLVGATVHVEDSTLARRVHDRNASGAPRSLYEKLRARLIMVQSMAVILARRARLRS